MSKKWKIVLSFGVLSSSEPILSNSNQFNRIYDALQCVWWTLTLETLKRHIGAISTLCLWSLNHKRLWFDRHKKASRKQRLVCIRRMERLEESCRLEQREEIADFFNFYFLSSQYWKQVRIISRLTVNWQKSNLEKSQTAFLQLNGLHSKDSRWIQYLIKKYVKQHEDFGKMVKMELHRFHCSYIR